VREVHILYYHMLKKLTLVKISLMEHHALLPTDDYVLYGYITLADNADAVPIL
jgi:hypothetical protein